MKNIQGIEEIFHNEPWTLPLQQEVNEDRRMKYASSWISPVFFLKKFFVASKLETLSKNSSSSHKGYLYNCQSVPSWFTCQVSARRGIYTVAGVEAGRPGSPTLLMNHRSLLLCTRVATFPTLCLPSHWRGSLPSHRSWMFRCCQEARLTECWFQGSRTREANSNLLNNLHEKWLYKT